eukprot:1158359-Pelagomonas_calceolata.AAC.5
MPSLLLAEVHPLHGSCPILWDMPDGWMTPLKGHAMSLLAEVLPFHGSCHILWNMPDGWIMPLMDHGFDVLCHHSQGRSCPVSRAGSAAVLAHVLAVPAHVLAQSFFHPDRPSAQVRVRELQKELKAARADKVRATCLHQ